MKRIISFIFIFVFSLLTVHAQPSWVKKSSKSVFTLKTFSTDGSLIASSNGFFIGTNGEAISCFSPFKGASRAIIIDAQGKEMNVECMLGANETYDVAKFRVNYKKSQPLPICTDEVTSGKPAWLLPYHEIKQIPNGLVSKSETFLDYYSYYTLFLQSNEQTVGCPLLNDEGEVFAILQPSAVSNDSLSYAVSVIFADSLRITGFSINDPVLNMTQIKKDLPDDLKEANLTIFLASAQTDSLTYAGLVDEMIKKFPEATEGYVFRAQLASSAGDYMSADQDINKALSLSNNKDETHFNYARLIYQKHIYNPQPPYDDWTLDKALSEIKEAINYNPLSTYHQLEADILFAQQKYDDAYQKYMQLSKSDIRSAAIFFSAARCKEMQKDTTAMLALMDSTLNTFSKPYLKEAAPYLWSRAEALRSAGKYRDAVADMNEYETLMAADINDNFYYIRHLTEIQGHLYQQALNDIDRAIVMNPEEILYLAEKASLEIRVGRYDQAIEAAKECIKLDASNSDGYLFLGLGLCLKDQKQEGIKNLQKAKELGDPQAEGLIEKFK